MVAARIQMINNLYLKSRARQPYLEINSQTNIFSTNGHALFLRKSFHIQAHSGNSFNAKAFAQYRDQI